MATRTIIETDCDRCEAKNVKVCEIRVATRWDTDPAGGPGEDGGVKFDLCINCLQKIVTNQIAIKFADYKEASKWIDSLNLKSKSSW